MQNDSNITLKEEENNQKGLVSRALDKLKTFGHLAKCCIKKRVVNFLITKVVPISMSLTLLFSGSGCGNLEDTQDSNANDIPKPPGITQPSDSSASPSPSDTDVENEEEYSEYSEFLRYVLESDYYNNLLEHAKSDEKFYRSGYFSTNPYGFYEAQGYNVEQIKKENMSAFTYSFVKDEEPTNLYMATSVESMDNSYYTQYLLKYNLTEKEMQDYQLASSTLQSFFINDSISRHKDAEIIYSGKIAKNTYSKLSKSVGNISAIEKYTDEGTKIMFFRGFDSETQTFDVYVINYEKGKYNNRPRNGHVMLLTFYATYTPIEHENDIYYGPTEFYTYYKLVGNYADCPVSDATIYFTHLYNFEYRKTLSK